MEKEKFISKLNIKDYNSQLERILSKKNFTENTKNLLLNMLYSVENAYNDYSLVTCNAKTKKEIFEEILEIISKDCNTIEIKNTKESECVIEEKKIITYLNAKKMLYELYQIRQKKFKVFKNYEIINNALETTINQGYSIASSEIIRDFNGWSWNIENNEIENIQANLIYQILRILVGDEFLNKWQNEQEQDYIAKLTEKLETLYKTELAEKILKGIFQISILNIVKFNQEEKKRLINIEEKLQQQIKEFENKKEYLEKLGKNKKTIINKIKEKDDIVNNDRKLKNEFIKRNELLDMNHRIFSLSNFVEILEKERQELVNELNECTKKMEPLNFIKIKISIENKLAIINELELKNNKKQKQIYNSKVKELLNLVCKAISIQIDNLEEKEDLIKIIYSIRYFGQIYVTNDTQIKDIISLNNIQKEITTKACKQKIISIFSHNIKENYEITKHIFQADIVELEKIYFKIMQYEGKILLKIYDEENIYKTIEFFKLEELSVKLNKKIKVFI